MAKKQIEYPCKGTLKATGEVVTVHGEGKVAGLKVLTVSHGAERSKYNYRRETVVVRPSS
jgi:hypothetical protein